MAKRIKLAEAASLSPPASFSDSHSSSDWTKCIICQDVTDERLECPADSKRKDAGAGYKSFTENLMRFSDVDDFPVKISLERLDDGDGIEAILRCRKASWHKSCHCKFNATKLERAKMRRSDNFKELDSVGGKYTRSQKKAKVDIKVACLFCDQVIRDEESREAMTFKVNSRPLECARLLEDEALLAKLSAGDVMAQEVKYHQKCLTGLYNRVRSLERSKRAAVSNEDMINSLALAELVSYIEDARTESSIAPVFQLSDLVTLYTSRIKELGLNVEKRVHSTKLKERILASIPDLKAHPQGKQVRLAFESDIGHVLSAACDMDYDNDAVVLAKAARIIRRDLFDLRSSTDEFSGSMMMTVKHLLFTCLC